MIRATAGMTTPHGIRTQLDGEVSLYNRVQFIPAVSYNLYYTVLARKRPRMLANTHRLPPYKKECYNTGIRTQEIYTRHSITYPLLEQPLVQLNVLCLCNYQVIVQTPSQAHIHISTANTPMNKHRLCTQNLKSYSPSATITKEQASSSADSPSTLAAS